MPGNDIDIKLKLDGERDFRAALKDANTELKNMQSALKLSDTQAKGQANTLDNLKKKEEALSKVLESATKKRETLTQIVDKAKAKQEEAAKALEKARNAENANAEEIAKAEKAYLSATQRVNEWETQLNKAEKEVAETNAEVDKNAKYLDEAKNSADGCATSIDEYGKEVKEADKGTADLNKQVGALTQMEAVSKIAEKAAGAFKKLNDAAASAAKELDVGYDTIVKKTGATGEAFEEMQDIANDLFGSMPVQMDEVGAAIGEINTRFGQTGDQLEDTSKKFIKFAKVNDTDVSTAVDDVQNAMAAFRVETKDAGRVLDTLTKTGQKTGANVANLSKKVTENATAFHEMGMDIYQSIDFMGKLETAGADSASVLSGLKRALKSATEEGKPLNQALAELEDNIRNGTESTDGLTVAYDLFGKSGAGVFQAVKNGQVSFKDLTDSTKILDEATGSLEQTYDNTLSAWDNYQVAQNNLKIAGSELSQTYQEALTPVVEKLTDVVTDATEKFKELPESAQTAIAVIGGIGGKALEVAPQIGSVITQLAALKIAKSVTGDASAATSKFTSSLKGAGVAIGVVGAAIGVATALYASYRRRIDEATASQRELLAELEGIDKAYDQTHQQVELLVSGENEYISTSERIAQLEALRVQVKDENIKANQNMISTEADLAAKTEELNAINQDYADMLSGTGDKLFINREEMEALGIQTDKLTEANRTASDTYQKSNADLELINATLEELKAQEASTAEVVAGAEADMSASHEASILKVGEEQAAYESLNTNVQTLAVQVSDAILAMHESVTGSISSMTSWFDAVEERSVQNADTMAANLEAQIKDIENWESNLAYLADKGINQELLQYLADMGPSGSAYVQALVDSANGLTETGLDEMNALWEEKLDLEKGINDEAVQLYDSIGEMAAGSEYAFDLLAEELNASATTVGENVALGMAEGIRQGKEDSDAAAEELGKGATDAAASGAETASPSKATTRTGKNIGEGMRNGINQSVSMAKSAATNMARQVINAINQAVGTGTAKTAGVTLGQQLQAGLTSSQSSIVSAARNAGVQAGTSLVSGITSQQGATRSAAATLVNIVVGELNSGSGSAYSAGANVSHNAVNGLYSAVNGAYGAGVDMARGMANGIYAGQSAVINAASAMAYNALNTAKSVLKIHSPSQAFEEEVGKQSALGAVKGFNETLDMQAGRMLSAFSGGLPDFSVYNAGATVVNEVRVYLGDKELTGVMATAVLKDFSARSRNYNANTGR